jgi:hypothetical protein
VTLVVEGYRELMRALDLADKKTKKAFRDELRKAGEGLRADAQRRFTPYDARVATGYRVIVRKTAIDVEQSQRKTTGRHPEFGTKQMVKALLPAKAAQEPHLEREVERAFERICKRI